MKAIKLILNIFIIIAIILITITGINSQSVNRMRDRFYLGPINCFFDYNKRTSLHKGYYRSLSYNMMQNYCAHIDLTLVTIPTIYHCPNKHYRPDFSYDAGFFDTLEYYQSFTDSIFLDWIEITQTKVRNPYPYLTLVSILFEREKILRPAFGQRSTYQAEWVGQWNSISPGYGYMNSETGRNTVDYQYGGINVRGCFIEMGDTAGYVVKGLYENCEQVNDVREDTNIANSSSIRLYSDLKQQGYNYRWFVKPRIRIDSNYAKANRDTSVVRIDIVNFLDTTIKSVEIQCKNFLDSNNNYNGNYLENYFNLDSSQTYKLSVLATDLANGRTGNNLDSSKVDYRVYWYGKVDIWLDYVRVDDEWAHYLFTDTLDKEERNRWRFHKKIKEEVEAYGNNPGLGFFYVDEMSYNNIPCLAEVNRLVKKYCPNTSLITSSSPSHFRGTGGLRNVPDSISVWNYLLTSNAVTDVIWGSGKLITVSFLQKK